MRTLKIYTQPQQDIVKDFRRSFKKAKILDMIKFKAIFKNNTDEENQNFREKRLFLNYEESNLIPYATSFIPDNRFPCMDVHLA